MMARVSAKSVTLVAVSVSTFMLPLDYTIVSVALHALQIDLGASFVDLQWIVNAYTLSFAAFLLAGGALADLFGRKRMFVVGLAIFMLGSLACGLAPLAAILQGARGVQGIGAALMYAAAVPLLVREFEGPDRARAFGIFGAIVGIGAALGPFLGGLIVGTLGWRWAFLVNVPVTAFVIGLTLWRVRESRDPNAAGLDWGGFITFSAACFLLVLALILGNDAGWSSLRIIGLLAGALLLLPAFAGIERLRAYPMFDLSLLGQGNFIGALLPLMVLSISFWGLFLYFPLYYQGVLGYSPLAAGAAVLPFAAPLFVMGPIGGWLAARIPSRSLLALGQGLVGVGAFLLLWETSASSTWTAFVLGGLVCGTGAGLINGEMTNVAVSIVPADRSGMASGISGTVRQLGVSLGFAGLGAILAHHASASLATAAHALGLPVDQIGPLTARVVKGDVHGAIMRAPASLRRGFEIAADASMFDALRAVAVAAGIVGFAGALLTYLLMRPLSVSDAKS